MRFISTSIVEYMDRVFAGLLRKRARFPNTKAHCDPSILQIFRTALRGH